MAKLRLNEVEKMVKKKINTGKIDSHKNSFFFQHGKAVKPTRIYSDRAWLEKNLRVGIELESSNIKTSVGDTRTLLHAQSDYDKLNNWVFDVVHDGSVSPRGVEVIFKGSNEDFKTYHKALKEVEDNLKILAVPDHCINNSTTSAHITLLTSQLKELPDTYLANLYQLFRKYADSLLWLASSTYEDRRGELPVEQGTEINRNRIVRKGITQYANPLMTRTPQTNRIMDIAVHYNSKYWGIFFKDSTTSTPSHKVGRQCWMMNGNPNGLCVEFRFVDRITVPYALVSIKCLLQALLFKAMAISEFGIMNIEANGNFSWEKTKQTTAKLCNGERLTKADKKYLTDKSNYLIDLLYGNLKSFDGQSIEVLRKLAEKPISLRYAEGQTDEQIEKALTPKKYAEFETERTVRNIIELQLIKADTPKKWRQSVADELGISERMVRHTLTRMSRLYNVGYDKEVKSYILIR